MEFKNQRNSILPLEHHVPDSEAHVMPDGKQCWESNGCFKDAVL